MLPSDNNYLFNPLVPKVHSEVQNLLFLLQIKL